MAKKTPWDIDATHFPRRGPMDEKAAFLAGYALLAPSSHNAQPWRFEVDGGSVTIRADLSGWLAVADPEKRELYISLGCALENLLVASEHFGLGADVEVRDDGETSVKVSLSAGGEPSSFRPPELFDSITSRRTAHRPFATRPVPGAALEKLRGTVAEEGLRLFFLTGVEEIERVESLVAEADRELMSDPEYRRELAEWVGRGSFGNNRLLARVAAAAIEHIDLGDRVARRDARLMASSPAAGVFASAESGRREWLDTGKAFERVSLTAEGLDLGLQPMSSPLELPSLTDELSGMLPAEGLHPHHLFRLGYPGPGEKETHTPRRPPGDVIS